MFDFTNYRDLDAFYMIDYVITRILEERSEIFQRIITK